MPLAPAERAVALEESSEIEEAHTQAAKQGDSAVPESAEAEVDYHYVCFVPSNKTQNLYELDGVRKGPVDRAIETQNGDVFNEGGLELIRNFLKREQGQNQNFSLMALVPA